MKFLNNAIDCLLLAVEQKNLAGVKLLLEKCHSNPNIMDKRERTPLTLAQNDTEMVKLLLKHGANLDNVYKSHSQYIGMLASERPPDNRLAVFITGDSGVGKSTMLKSLLSPKGFLTTILTKSKPVTGVDEKTVGIIPHDIETKEFGNITCYDFAGQQEFYASHCAVLKNAAHASAPIIIYLADLQDSEKKIADSTARWMNLVQNQCTNLKGKAHVIVIGSHADKLVGNPRNKEHVFAPVIQKFSMLQFKAFTPMDCRFADSDHMKKLRKQIQESSVILRSSETISLNAHSFFIYFWDNFKNCVAVSVSVIQQKIHTDQNKSESEHTRNLLSFIPSTLPRLIEICDQLNKKGLLLFLHNVRYPEKSFIICDRVTLLSKVTGTVFAPENFSQHCSLASSTGVVPLPKFSQKFVEYNIEMLISFMSHLVLCFEITDKEVLDCMRKRDDKPEPNRRYLFFPGLIKIDFPEQVWEDDPNMKYHFGWIVECSQERQFFDPRCLQVLILRLVFSFDLAPASKVQEHIPSLQRFCSVWKNGIFWINESGIASHLELSDSGKYFALKVRSRVLKNKCLIYRAKIIQKVLDTIKDFCSNIKAVESVIDPQEIVKHPLKSASSLTLCSISDIASAIIANKEDVKSQYRVLTLESILQFEPFASLDQDTLQCINSNKNVMKDKKISNAFISHFASQISSDDIYMYTAMFSADGGQNNSVSNTRQKRTVTFRQELIQTLQTWRNKTEGSYLSLRETLNKYSIFIGRNPLVRFYELFCRICFVIFNHMYSCHTTGFGRC